MDPKNLPTKAELKTKYGIASDDFKVLTRDNLPGPGELKQGEVLQQVADWCGLPTYLWRLGTVILAVLLLPAHVDTFKEDAMKSLQFYAGIPRPFQNLPQPPRQLPDSYFSYANVATTSSSIITVTISPPAASS